MADDLLLLQQIRVASPCRAAWEEMAGDDRVRYCEECRLNVYNLSGMAVHEAAELIRETEGRLCVRYYARDDGTMLVKDCPVGFRAARRVLLTQIGAIATGFVGVFGLVPLITGRWQAIRNSTFAQTEPFCRVFDWLDPRPLVSMPLGMIRAGTLAPSSVPSVNTEDDKRRRAASTHRRRKRRSHRHSHRRTGGA